MEKAEEMLVVDDCKAGDRAGNSLMGLPFAGVFDILDGPDRDAGFIDLLGISDLSSLDFGWADKQDLNGGNSAPSSSLTFNSGEVGELPDASSTVPPTPNSSISSSSEEANEDESNSRAGKDQRVTGDQQEKEKRLEKTKKRGAKREREPRFAFMTKSNVDHLEDGYRWRKYGQKAVKNSPFPRSYYRCTSPKCGVKKRVERSVDDPSVVITTYEGQHTHHTPAVTRAVGQTSASAAYPPASQHQQQRPLHVFSSHALNMSIAADVPPQPLDYGLLYDILSPRVRE